MSLDADTNKAGINALARAHAMLILVPQLLEKVKHHIQCPNWQMGALVWEIEKNLEHREADEKQIQALYEAMQAPRNPVPRMPSCTHQAEPYMGPCAECGRAGVAYLTRDPLP